jgi:hypothetical protein
MGVAMSAKHKYDLEVSIFPNQLKYGTGGGFRGFDVHLYRDVYTLVGHKMTRTVLGYQLWAFRVVLWDKFKLLAQGK